MKKEKISTKSKVAATAVVIGSLLVGALGGAFVADDSSQVQDLEIAVEVAQNAALNANAELEAYEPVIETRIVNQTVEVEVEVVNPVNELLLNQTIDLENSIDLITEEIFDNKGKVQYLTLGLDDDELDQIIDRIVFIQDIKALAVNEVKSEFKDLMDKEDQGFGVKFFDEDEIERVSVQDESDEVETDDVDYDDKDADVIVEVNFEQDDVKYVATVIVEIKDNEVEDIDLDSVRLR